LIVREPIVRIHLPPARSLSLRVNLAMVERLHRFGSAWAYELATFMRAENGVVRVFRRGVLEQQALRHPSGPFPP
jgi:hypothetical protein